MIIGISGKKQHGKDLIGEIIQYLTHPSKYKSFKNYQKNSIKQNSGWRIVKFADKLKDIVCLLLGCTREQLEDDNFKNKEVGDEWRGWYYDELTLNPRVFLQYIGTDLFRNNFHPNTWVNAMMSDYKGTVYVDGHSANEVYSKWLITDVRFENEAQAIKQRGGVLIRVNRPSIKSNDMHESEIALDQFTGFDYVITNNGSIDDLIIQVKDILVKEKIL